MKGSIIQIGSYPPDVLERIALGDLVLGKDESFAVRRIAVLWLQVLGFPLKHVVKSRALPAVPLYPCPPLKRRTRKPHR